MTEEINTSAMVQGTEMQREQITFWDGEGRIVPHLLYQYFESKGIGKYFPDDSNRKNTDPIIVSVNGNVVSPVNVGYVLEITKNYIFECCSKGNGDCGSILNSLHSKTSLFSDKNLKLLPTLKLEFICDSPDSGFFFFRNGVVEVKGDNIQIRKYEEFDRYVWENSIIRIDFEIIDQIVLEQNCDFSKFVKDLTIVADNGKSIIRLKALSSAIGYLLHRYKNPTTTKSIILMDVYVNGKPNGGSGKTLLINAIGKARNLSVIDGKKYDQKEWFGLSSVELNTEVLLFDDVESDFNFELIFPLMTTGMFVRRKYKDHIFIPYEKSPKVAITTNYAIKGDTSSFRRRMYEFEVSATYSADYTPREKFTKNFFDGWNAVDWNYFFNTMFNFLQVYLKDGLVESEPINMLLTKLINQTCEEFVDWADQYVQASNQYDKKILYDRFISAYPEFKTRLKQREFTNWLRVWGEYNKFKVTETHSDNVRYISFVN